MVTPSGPLMLAAIAAARQSRVLGDYAVGSVLAREGQIIATAGNRTHLDCDATQHAEMIVIRLAARTLRTKDLSGCILYSTHEPCAMCMGAVIWARVPCVVFGATLEDHKRYRDEHGNARWRWRVIDLPAAALAARGDPVVQLIGGFMRAECTALFHNDRSSAV